MSKRFALLAGVNDYGEESGLGPLRFAEADARHTAEVLQELCGFEPPTVLLGREARRGAITHALEAYYDLDPELFVFFFAGHGELLRGSGTHSLHCYGSRLGDTVDTLSLSEWAERIRAEVAAQSSIMIVDACRNNVYRHVQHRGAAPGLDASVYSALKKVADRRDLGLQGRNRQGPRSRMYTLLGCSAGQVSYEDAELKQGVFTHALIEEIRARGQQFHLSELRKQIGQRTLDWCLSRGYEEQVPEWIEPSLPGEVWLRTPSTTPPEPPPEDPRAWQLLGRAKLLEGERKLLEARSLLVKAQQLATGAAGPEIGAALQNVRARIRDDLALEPRPGTRVKTLAAWAGWALAHPEDAPGMLEDAKLPAWLADALERRDAVQALARARAESVGLWQTLDSFLRESAALPPEQVRRLDETQKEVENWLSSGETCLAKRKPIAAREMFSLAADRDPRNPRVINGLSAAAALHAEEQRWEQAEKANRFEAYRGYLAAYPSGWYAEQALTRLETLDAIVSPAGEGFYRTIGEAIRGVNSRQKILVRPGVYKEGLVFDRSVEIVGDGPAGEIVVQSENAPCVLIRTSTASLTGLTLRCTDAQGRFAAVHVPQGKLVLTECDISSTALACVAISGKGTETEIRKCRIHDGHSCGLLACDDGHAIVEDCEIFRNTGSGIETRDGGNAELRQSRICDGVSAGVFIRKRGQGTVEDCEITGNANGGFEVHSHGVIRNSRFSDNKPFNVRFREKGGGTVENCTFASQTAAVDIGQGCDVKLVGVPATLVTRPAPAGPQEPGVVKKEPEVVQSGPEKSWEKTLWGQILCVAILIGIVVGIGYVIFGDGRFPSAARTVFVWILGIGVFIAMVTGFFSWMSKLSVGERVAAVIFIVAVIVVYAAGWNETIYKEYVDWVKMQTEKGSTLQGALLWFTGAPRFAEGLFVLSLLANNKR